MEQTSGVSYRLVSRRVLRWVKWSVVILSILVGVAAIYFGTPRGRTAPSPSTAQHVAQPEEMVTLSLMTRDGRPLEACEILGARNGQVAHPCKRGRVEIPSSWSPLSIRCLHTAMELLVWHLRPGVTFERIIVPDAIATFLSPPPQASDEVHE